MCWSGRLGVEEGRIGGIFLRVFSLPSAVQSVRSSVRCDQRVCLEEASMGVPVDDSVWTGYLVL